MTQLRKSEKKRKLKKSIKNEKINNKIE